MGIVDSVLAQQPDPQLEEYLQQVYRDCGYARYPRYPLSTPRFGPTEILPVQDHRFLIRKTYRYSDPWAFASDARNIIAFQVNKVPNLAPLLGVEARVQPQGMSRTFETNIYFEYPLFLLDDYIKMLKAKPGSQPLKADELLRILKIGVSCISFLSQSNEVHGDMRASCFGVYRRNLNTGVIQQPQAQTGGQVPPIQIPKIDLSNGLRDLDIMILPTIPNSATQGLLATAQIENTLSNLRMNNPSMAMLAPELNYKLEQFGTKDPIDPYTNKKVPFQTDKSDIFTLGLMILELGTLMDIVPQVSKPNAMVDQEALMRAEHMFTLQHGNYHSLPDILSKMLSVDPNTRIHPQELHRFLEDPSPQKVFPYAKVVGNLVLTPADRNNTAGRQVGFDIYGRPVYEGGANPQQPGQGMQAGGGPPSPVRPQTQGKPEYSLPPLFGALDIAATPAPPILPNNAQGPQGRNMLNQQQTNPPGSPVDKTKLVQEYLNNLNALSTVLMEMGPSRDPEIQRLQDAVLRPRDSGMYSYYGGASSTNSSWIDGRGQSTYGGGAAGIPNSPIGYNYMQATPGQPMLISEPPMAGPQPQGTHLRSAHAALNLANSQVFQREELEREAARKNQAVVPNQFYTQGPHIPAISAPTGPTNSPPPAKSPSKYKIFG